MGKIGSLIGILFLIVGFVYLFNFSSGITGFVVFDNVGQGLSGLAGLWFVFSGLIVLYASRK